MEERRFEVISLSWEQAVAVLALIETYLEKYGEGTRREKPELFEALVRSRFKLNALVTRKRSTAAV
jgi:hypothetical protein